LACVRSAADDSVKRSYGCRNQTRTAKNCTETHLAVNLLTVSALDGQHVNSEVEEIAELRAQAWR